MTQKYYVERLLPIYCQAVESMRQIDDKPWLLQEDGDPSHGIRKRGLAQEYKEAHGIKNLKHPAQSPYLTRSRWRRSDFALLIFPGDVHS